MKVTLVAKLKLHPTPEQFKALRQTQLAYRDALNYVSQYAYEHGKMSNKVHLQDGTYREIRARFKIPAQMACSIPRQVGATYKGLWTKVKKKAGQCHPLQMGIRRTARHDCLQSGTDWKHDDQGRRPLHEQVLPGVRPYQ